MRRSPAMSPEVRAMFITDILVVQTRLLDLEHEEKLRIPETPIQAWGLIVAMMLATEGQMMGKLIEYAILLYAIAEEPGVLCAVGWPHGVETLREWLFTRSPTEVKRDMLQAMATMEVGKSHFVVLMPGTQQPQTSEEEMKH